MGRIYPVKHKLDDSEEENMTVISIGDETFQQYDERRPSKRLKRDMLRNMYNKKIVNSSQDILSSINKNLQSPKIKASLSLLKKNQTRLNQTQLKTCRPINNSNMKKLKVIKLTNKIF